MQPQHRQKMKPHKLERLYRQTVNYEVALINVQEMRQKGAFFAFAFLFVIPEGNLLFTLALTANHPKVKVCVEDAATPSFVSNESTTAPTISKSIDQEGTSASNSSPAQSNMKTIASPTKPRPPPKAPQQSP
jgi:hypothetical protein